LFSLQVPPLIASFVRSKRKEDSPNLREALENEFKKLEEVLASLDFHSKK
jgi:hypothetical protein